MLVDLFAQLEEQNKVLTESQMQSNQNMEVQYQDQVKKLVAKDLEAQLMIKNEKKTIELLQRELKKL